MTRKLSITIIIVLLAAAGALVLFFAFQDKMKLPAADESRTVP